MPESSMIQFGFQELAEILLKTQGIHSGLWGIYVKFGIGAGNVPDPAGQFLPTAIVPIKEIGLQKFDEQNNLAVDASVVNPRPKGAKQPQVSNKKAKSGKRRVGAK